MANAIAVKEQAPLSPFGSIDSFETCQRMAKALAASTFIPKAFKGNVGDCLIILETASRSNMPIMALMQNMYVVHGKPSMSSSFMAGLINNSNRFDGPLRFIYNDDRTECYAVATKDGQEYRSIVVSIDMAKNEGWMSKSGSKWKTMSDVMLQYRAISFFARAYCADLIMGMRTVDELRDMPVDDVVPQDGAAKELNEKFAPPVVEEKVDTGTGEIIDVEPEQVDPPGDTGSGKDVDQDVSTDRESKHYRTRPKVIAAFKKEIDAIENSMHLDRWRQKHQNRVVRELPKESDQTEVFAYAQGVYESLLAKESENKNIPPSPAEEVGAEETTSKVLIYCPNGNGDVTVDYCEAECPARDGCPALSNL